MEQIYFPQREYKVLVSCMTYNQSKYIEDALNGFAVQQTEFPFVCLVMDDCSTDGEQEVIKSWMTRECDMGKAENLEIEKSHITIVPHKSKPGCHIAFYFLKQNLCGKDEKKQLVTPWRERCEYEALCEGDDYWTDPKKLQKQVEFLDANTEYSMCCSDAIIKTNNDTEDWARHKENTLLSPEEVILGGGLYIQTATLLYRKSLLEGYPEYCLKCHVGDYPLKIWGAINGGLYYFSDKMAAYRFQTVGSWTSQINNTPIEKLIHNWRSEIEMLKGLDVYSNGKYTNSFRRREANYIFWAMRNHKEHWKTISHEFSDIKSSMTIKQRIADFVMTHNLTWLYNCLARFQ